MTLDGVVAVGGVDGDGVGLGIAAVVPGCAEVEVDLADGGGEVVDGDGVGAAEGVDVDVLDVVGVHGHVATSRKADAVAIGGEGDLLVGVEPLKTIVSLPAWPSTVSLPSPGFQMKVSSPAPSRAASLPGRR